MVLHPPRQPRFAHIFGGLDEHNRLPRFGPQQLLKAEEFAFLVDKKGRVVNIAHKLLRMCGTNSETVPVWEIRDWRLETREWQYPNSSLESP